MNAHEDRREGANHIGRPRPDGFRVGAVLPLDRQIYISEPESTSPKLSNASSAEAPVEIRIDLADTVTPQPPIPSG